jgi:hypothetical protein
MTCLVLLIRKPFLFFLNNLKIATMLPLLEENPLFAGIYFAGNLVSFSVTFCFPYLTQLPFGFMSLEDSTELIYNRAKEGT